MIRIGEVRAVQAVLDPDGTAPDESKALATECIEALDKARAKQDRFVVVARIAAKAPLICRGVFTTKTKANNYLHQVPIQEQAQGVGAVVLQVRPEENAT